MTSPTFACRAGGCTWWLYLVAVLDWYSRYVVSWELDQTLELPSVLAAMGQALQTARPQICNSDQGSQFTSPQWIGLLQAAGVSISMNGKGWATDNIFVERLWRTVKYEEVYLHDYGSPREARQGLARYFEFYNYRRLHQALDYRTPGEVYSGARGAAPLGGQGWAQQPALSRPAQATTMHLSNGPLPVLTTDSIERPRVCSTLMAKG